MRSYRVVLIDGTEFNVDGVEHVYVTDWWRFYSFIDAHDKLKADVPVKLLKYTVEIEKP